MPSRRRFLRDTALISLAPTIPLFLSRFDAEAQETASQNGRILVVLQLDGGNDGINTIVPFRDEAYAKNRRQLRLPDAELLKISDEFAMHPRLRSVSQLYEQGRLSIVHGVGYPNPNRSHFESMKIWHAGSTDQEMIDSSNGWIGEAFSSGTLSVSESPQAIHVGSESLPRALLGRRCVASSIAHADDLKLKLDWGKPDRGTDSSRSDSLSEFVNRRVSDAYASVEQLRQASVGDSSARYPESRLGQKLKLVSQLIKTDTKAQVYYAVQPGYDTHAGQLSLHGDLLGDLSGALKAFTDDMKHSGLEDRVLVMCFSEFGRRVEENDSLGTDHGTAGPVFLAGSKLASRNYGELPKLGDLDDGDLKHNVDFRSLYATILSQWLEQEVPRGLADAPSMNLFS